MSRLAVPLLVIALAAVACSRSPAETAIAETADQLREVESADIEFSVTARQESAEQPVGFRVSGPFSFTEGMSLPVADLEFTQLAGSEQATTSFISTGEETFVEVEGRSYELPADQVESMRLDDGEPAEVVGLDRLRLDQWLEDAELTSGEGVDTVTGQLDVVEVVNDLMTLSAEFGAELLPGVDHLEGQDAEQLERSVRASAFELTTGSEDRMLRRLVMEVTFGTPDDEELPESIRDLEGALVRMELALADPNQPVSVEAPASPRPYAELTSPPAGATP